MDWTGRRRTAADGAATATVTATAQDWEGPDAWPAPAAALQLAAGARRATALPVTVPGSAFSRLPAPSQPSFSFKHHPPALGRTWRVPPYARCPCLNEAILGLFVCPTGAISGYYALLIPPDTVSGLLAGGALCGADEMSRTMSRRDGSTSMRCLRRALRAASHRVQTPAPLSQLGCFVRHACALLLTHLQFYTGPRTYSQPSCFTTSTLCCRRGRRAKPRRSMSALRRPSATLFLLRCPAARTSGPASGSFLLVARARPRPRRCALCAEPPLGPAGLSGSRLARRAKWLIWPRCNHHGRILQLAVPSSGPAGL